MDFWIIEGSADIPSFKETFITTQKCKGIVKIKPLTFFPDKYEIPA
jgi:hypothetical protein